MRKILLILLFVFTLFAGESEGIVPIIKHKTKVSKGIGHTKLKIDLVCLKLNKNLNKLYDFHYMFHASAFLGEIPIFDAVFSPYLSDSMDGGIQFKFKDIAVEKNITLKVMDNRGCSAKEIFEVERDSFNYSNEKIVKNTNEIPIKIDFNAIDASTISEAIIALYGLQIPESIQTHFTKNNEKYLSLGEACLSKDCYIDIRKPVSVVIESTIDLNSIAIFSTATPKPLLAFIQIPNNDIVYIKIPFKFEKSGELFCIAKGNDGKLYQSKAHNIAAIARSENDSFQVMYFYLDTENKTKTQTKEK